jgi:hypothetical protein
MSMASAARDCHGAQQEEEKLRGHAEDVDRSTETIGARGGWVSEGVDRMNLKPRRCGALDGTESQWR